MSSAFFVLTQSTFMKPKNRRSAGLRHFSLLAGISLLTISPMHTFAESSHPKLEIITVDDQPWYEAADRAVARQIASPGISKAQAMSIAEIIIPAGVEIVPHHHRMEEVYYVVSGSGTMMVDDIKEVVKAGQSVIIAPHQWHNIVNHTEEELRLIVTCAPAWKEEYLEFDRSTIPE